MCSLITRAFVITCFNPVNEEDMYHAGRGHGLAVWIDQPYNKKPRAPTQDFLFETSSISMLLDTRDYTTPHVSVVFFLKMLISSRSPHVWLNLPLFLRAEQAHFKVLNRKRSCFFEHSPTTIAHRFTALPDTANTQAGLNRFQVLRNCQIIICSIPMPTGTFHAMGLRNVRAKPNAFARLTLLCST